MCYILVIDRLIDSHASEARLDCAEWRCERHDHDRYVVARALLSPLHVVAAVAVNIAAGLAGFSAWKKGHNNEAVMKVLMVITSHDQLGNTGRETGFWLEELAAPYYVFKDAGVEVTLASPNAGRPPLDPKSNKPEFRTDLTRRFEKVAAHARNCAYRTSLLDNERYRSSRQHGQLL